MKVYLGEFSLRPATNRDINAVKEVVFSSLQEFQLPFGDQSKDADLNNLESNYFEKGGYFGVIEITSTRKIIGTIGLHATDALTCELRKNYIEKSHRGKGLGKWMLSSAISIAREKGFHKIMLETISPLKVAIDMYRQFGFKEIPIKEVNDRVDQAFELEIS